MMVKVEQSALLEEKDQEIAELKQRIMQLELQNVEIAEADREEAFAFAVQEVQMGDDDLGEEPGVAADGGPAGAEGEASHSKRRALADESDDLVEYRGRRRTNSLRVGHQREDYTKEVRANLVTEVTEKEQQL